MAKRSWHSNSWELRLCAWSLTQYRETTHPKPWRRSPRFVIDVQWENPDRALEHDIADLHKRSVANAFPNSVSLHFSYYISWEKIASWLIHGVIQMWHAVRQTPARCSFATLMFLVFNDRLAQYIHLCAQMTPTARAATDMNNTQNLVSDAVRR